MDIKPYGKNAKKHPAPQLRKLAKSITQFGFLQAILVDAEGVIIVGHGRYLAATKMLGWTEVREAPVAKKGEEFIPYQVIDNLTEDEVKAYRLADNKLNESGWDMELVAAELQSILDTNLRDTTGFDVSQEKLAFDAEFLKYTDENAEYPLNPKFSEKHDIFVIVSGNEIDTENLRAVLGIDKAKSYKTGLVGRTHVADVGHVLKHLGKK